MNLALNFRDQFVGDLWAVGEEFDQLLAALNARIPIANDGSYTFGSGSQRDLTVRNLTFIDGGEMKGDLISNGTIRWLRGPWLLDDAQERHDIAMLRPPDPAGTINDYEPPGLDNAVGADIEPTAALTLTGLKATHGRQKRLFILRNRDSSNSITLKDQDAGSAVGNRFDFTGAAGTGTGGAAHTMLDGSIHSDSVVQTVSRGSLIYGNATPKWDELVVGAANRVLRSDGTDVSWAQVNAATDVIGVLPIVYGGTGSDTGGLLFTTVTIAEAALETLNATPVTLVAAVSGKIIVPVQAYVQKVVSSVYSNNPVPIIRYAAFAGALTGSASISFTTANTSYYQMGALTVSNFAGSPINTSLQFTLNAELTGTGAGSLVIELSYYVSNDFA